MLNITAKEFEQMIKDTLLHEFSTDLKTASYEDIYKAAAFNVRKIMSARQKEFMAKANGQGAKQIYYLCIEFLMGRSLKTNLFNLGLNEVASQVWATAVLAVWLPAIWTVSLQTAMLAAVTPFCMNMVFSNRES